MPFEAIIFTKEDYQELLEQMKSLNSRIVELTKDRKKFIIENNEFVRIMKISKRTAQTWRDEGKISFSQIGAKIYYSLSDIEEMLNRHHFKAFKK